ncbi:MAG: ATP-binding protein [Bacillota bacterium]
MRRLLLRQKLYLIMLIVLIPMIILEIYRINKGYIDSIKHEINSNIEFANAVGVSFSNFIHRIWDAELAVGSSIVELNITDNNKIRSVMKELSKSQPIISTYGWVNSNGIIIVSSEEDATGIDISDRDYFKRIMNGEDKVLSDLLVSKLDNRYSFIAARGIRQKGMLKGIVIAVMQPDALDKVLPSDRTSRYSYFGLIDSKGYFVYRYGISGIAQQSIRIPDDSPSTQVLKNGTTLSTSYISALDGKKYLGTDTIIREIGWVAYANSAYEEALSDAHLSLKNNIIILVSVSIICLLLSLRMIGNILKSINILKDSAQKVAEGNLNVRTEIYGRDELAAAGLAFDRMAASIEEYDKLKNQFFSNLSHELKTPLNIILASVQMLDKAHEEHRCEHYEKNARYLGMMRQNCFRLLRLINNLIDITRIDAGYLKMNMQNHNIVSIVEDITLSVAKYIEHKHINLIFDTEIEEKLLQCDPDKIERIMLNLLSNAIKFTKPGGSIYVNIYYKDNLLSISVRDTGLGIPEDKLSIIFERFRQVDTSLNRENEGSGIGLSLVDALVKAHGGSISVKSKLGEGSEFIIELPCSHNEQQTSQSEKVKTQVSDRVHKINIEFSDIYSL